MNCDNAGEDRIGGQELGAWLRQQREARGWACPEMARRLIEAARASGDISVPGVGTLARSIYRWERGTVGPSERYRLYYCQAFGIPAADFGNGQANGLACRITIPAAEITGLLADLRALFRDYRRARSSSGERKASDILGVRDRMASLPDPGDALRIAAFTAGHAGWSAFWDKRHGVWRVSEDDPHSGLYAESDDADEVLEYMAAHS